MVALNDDQDSSGSGDLPPAAAPVEAAENPLPTTIVRYGLMGFVGEFTYRPNLQVVCGANVIVQTNRGIEMGAHLPLTCADCRPAVTAEQINHYMANSGPDCLRTEAGKILRMATTDDVLEEKRLAALAPDQFAFCREAIAKHDLPMKLVTCENLFGGERIVFYFVADGRVDFRELVKDLAKEFQTRIEMRQIGARDEARLVADYETCGRQCCCKNFLKTLKPVSMKMAKLQKATLDPSKVSGRCGRLKCCLRYEHDNYEDLMRRLPRIGTRIRTPYGTGNVVDRQIITQLVQYHNDDGRLLTVAIEDILEQNLPPADPKQSDDPPASAGAKSERNAEDLEDDENTNGERPAQESGRRPRRRRRGRNRDEATPESESS